MHLRDLLVVSSLSFVPSTFAHSTYPADDALVALAGRSGQPRCGPGFGKCGGNSCCSPFGFCGMTAAHCQSPDCQAEYGHCDSLRTPDGPPTTDIPRPQVGNVPYAPQLISACTVPGTVALTFDDGPNQYTTELLDLLDRHNAKATFFVNGINNGRGQIDDPSRPWLKLIQRMQLSGHQVASHTWSHPELNQLSSAQRRDEMIKNEAALRNILGAFPTYMRPPYSRCDAACLNDISELGYHVVLYDIDTKDFENDSPTAIQTSKDIFNNALAPFKTSDQPWLVIAHDVHEQTVHNLTEHMLKKLSNDGYRAVTVGDCLGDPSELWYRRDTRPIESKKPTDKKPECSKRNACIGTDFDGTHKTEPGDISYNSTITGNATLPDGKAVVSGNATQASQFEGERVSSQAASVFLKTNFAAGSIVLVMMMAMLM
ncbi:hypothetical protein MAP00_007216 [Monascus purpureus]|nr:hypothetical protein MAP00_007216 [Monascus purpureus]